MTLGDKKTFIYILMLTFFSLISTGRNMIWHHDIPLWSDTAFKSASKVRPLNGLGLSYMRGGFLDKAKVVFEKSLSINPINISTHTNLGVLYFAMEDFTSSEREFRAILKHNPTNIKAKFNLSVLLYKHLDKTLEAKEILLELIENPIVHPKIYYTLGEVYRLQNMRDKARLYYKKALAVDRKYKEALDSLNSL